MASSRGSAESRRWPEGARRATCPRESADETPRNPWVSRRRGCETPCATGAVRDRSVVEDQVYDILSAVGGRQWDRHGIAGDGSWNRHSGPHLITDLHDQARIVSGLDGLLRERLQDGRPILSERQIDCALPIVLGDSDLFDGRGLKSRRTHHVLAVDGNAPRIRTLSARFRHCQLDRSIRRLCGLAGLDLSRTPAHRQCDEGKQGKTACSRIHGFAPLGIRAARWRDSGS